MFLLHWYFYLSFSLLSQINKNIKEINVYWTELCRELIKNVFINIENLNVLDMLNITIGQGILCYHLYWKQVCFLSLPKLLEIICPKVTTISNQVGWNNIQGLHVS